MLSSSMRSNLNSADLLMKQMESTQERVSTGRAVNSASDDAYAYFTENSLRDTASDLDFYAKEMDRGIKTIKSATSAINAMQDLADRAEGIARAALETEDRWERDGLRQQYADVMDSIGDMAKNAEYRGVNLLGGTGDDLSIQLDANGTNFLNVSSTDFTNVENIDGSFVAGTDGIAEFSTGIDSTNAATHTANTGIADDSVSLTDASIGYAAGDTITLTLGDGANSESYTYTVDEDSTISTFITEVNGSGLARAEFSGGNITYTSAGENSANVTITDTDNGGGVAGGPGVSIVTGTATVGSEQFDDATTGTGAGANAYFNLDINIEAQLDNIDSLKTTLSAKEGELANFEVIAESFSAFAEQMVSLLEEGADNLVMADMEEESVKLNVLQTRQQLAMISISLGNQAEQNVLRLF